MHPKWKRSTALALVVVLALAMVVPQHAVAQPGPKNGSLTVPIAVSDFVGTFTINRFERQNDKIMAIGTIVGTRGTDPTVGVQATAVEVKKMIPGGAPATAAAVTTLATCNILTLDLGPLHLNLLGLVVDLNEVILTITGETGAGNLLGNLLCAIAGLLDPVSGLPLGNALNQIISLLNRILAAL